MIDFDKWRLFNYYLIQVRSLENIISWYCLQTKNYIYESSIYSELWSKEVPKLQAHFLCAERIVLTFEEFWSDCNFNIRKQIIEKYDKDYHLH